MPIRRLLKRLVALAAVLAGAAAQADPVRLVALGDMPYGPPEEVYPPYQVLIDLINERPPDLVLHVGDTKAGSVPCTDRILAEQRAFMMMFQAPVLYAVGDNEWTDCHRASAGSYDPFGRLRLLRKLYFAGPHTLGVPVPVERSRRPEQARIRVGDVLFVTLHVTGSDNGRALVPFDRRDSFRARTRAAVDWLEDSFAVASGAGAIVIGLHADMFRKRDFKPNKQAWRKGSAYRDVGKALERLAAEFGGPVLLIFGDSHEHRVFRPFPETAGNLTAMEVFGAPDMHAVEVLIDPDGSVPFRFARVANPARP